jgi:hypothetical protein
MTIQANTYAYMCPINSNLVITSEELANPEDIMCNCCDRKGFVKISKD